MTTSPIKRQIKRFHVVVVQWTSKKCTKKSDARAELLFWSLNLLLFWNCRLRSSSSCLSSLLRKREHQDKTGGNWGEEGRRTSLFPPLPPFPRSRAYIFACLSFTYASSLLSESLEQAIILVGFSVLVHLPSPLIFQFGDSSGLHLIIFDEFDAVCKSRYMYNVRTCTWWIILIPFAVLVLRITGHCCLWALYRSNFSLCLLIFLVEWRNRRSRLSCQSTSGEGKIIKEFIFFVVGLNFTMAGLQMMFAFRTDFLRPTHHFV